MKRKLLAATAALPLCLGAAFVSLDAARSSAVPFLDPVSIARSLCGRNAEGLSRRRELFVSAAAAYGSAYGTSEESQDWPRLHDAIHYPTGSSSALAQAWFDQGLADLFNFHHASAVEAFRKAQAADPDCALCYWAEAYALGPNINAPMAPGDNPAALAAARKAASLKTGDPVTDGLSAAIVQRYAETPPEDRSSLDAAFADAMQELADTHPDNDFVLTLATEANMDTQPWDYWASGGRMPKGRTADSLANLETVLRRSPDHIPAIHLFIHMTEASTDPYRAIPYADELRTLAGDLGHLVHMPSHTYYRVGQYRKSLLSNIDAVATDERLIAEGRASEFYEYGYYVHNVHFALTSAQMGGDGATALAMAAKLDTKLPVEMAQTAPWIQPIKAAPYYAQVQFAEPETILALKDPGDELPFLKSAWHYARGEAFARTGQTEAAFQEAKAIEKLEVEADFSDLIGGGVPATEVLAVSRLTVEARAHAHAGELNTAIALMEEAVAIQETMTYMEPPWWYYPSKQTLAGYLLADGQTDRAEQVFIETLAVSPNNAWVLFGLSEVYAAERDKGSSRYAKRLFDKAWLGDKRHRPNLVNL
ncbi:MAG: hypothetical protein V2I43_13645 [Parvularcula sp.]|jgi:tetratricopeptide (TPR) repeat protein|nr:hypothetical protein [Parvularcula sp.]